MTCAEKRQIRNTDHNFFKRKREGGGGGRWGHTSLNTPNTCFIVDCALDFSLDCGILLTLPKKTRLRSMA